MRLFLLLVFSLLLNSCGSDYGSQRAYVISKSEQEIQDEEEAGRQEIEALNDQTVRSAD